MKIKSNLAILGLLLLFITTSFAEPPLANGSHPLTTEVALPLPTKLTDFASNKGRYLLKKNADKTTLKLLANFTTQLTTTYCGVASVVMVLNSSSLPKPPDPNHKPYNYFTQEDFFNAKVSEIISRDDVLATGIPLLQLNEIIQSFGLKSELYYADKLSLRDFRKALKAAVLNNQFVIVNFLRSELNQAGGGHHSPLAAYDEETDRFLLLDVARYKYPAYWVRTKDLHRATKTFDDGTSRGFVVIRP